jgi:aldehyde dehydrogenase (NAD+)
MVFDGVGVHSRLAEEEVFGPVVGIIRARDLKDALFKANAVGYGLAASVVTNDLRRALTFVDRIEAGVVKINEPTTGLALQAPSAASTRAAPTPSRSRGRQSSSSSRALGRCTSPTDEAGTSTAWMRIPTPLRTGLW